VHPDFAYLFTSMTVADFKRFKRAFRILLASGIPPEEAVTILLSGRDRSAKRRQPIYGASA